MKLMKLMKLNIFNEEKKAKQKAAVEPPNWDALTFVVVFILLLFLYLTTFRSTRLIIVVVVVYQLNSFIRLLASLR